MSELYVWGWNAKGSLGLGDWDDRYEPTLLSNGWDTVALGSNHAVAITTGGELYSWGWNYYGQLGLGDLDDRNTPTRVGNDSDWAQVICGNQHTIAIKESGALYAWGNNGDGALGLGDWDDRTTPTRVGNDSDWSFGFGGAGMTFMVNSSGVLYSCGKNTIGALGLGDQTDRNTLTEVTSGVTDGDGGYYASMILKGSTLYVSGSNGSGKLGLGGGTNSVSVFTEMSGSWSKVLLGQDHSLLLATDGTLHTAGDNSYAQLGLGSGVGDTYTFTQIGSDSDWADILVGGYHNLARKTDNALWAWGANWNGRLGDGTTTTRWTPISIADYTISSFPEATLSNFSAAIMALVVQWGPLSHPSGIDTLSGGDVYITAITLSGSVSWASCMPSFLMSGTSLAYGWKIHEGIVGEYFPLNVGNLSVYLYGSGVYHVTSGTTWESSTIHTLASGEKFVDMQEVDTDTYHLAKYGGAQGAIYELTETMSEYVGTAFQPSSLYVVYDYEVNDFIGASGSQSGPIRRYNPTDGWAEQTGIPETAITDIDGSYW